MNGLTFSQRLGNLLPLTFFTLVFGIALFWGCQKESLTSQGNAAGRERPMSDCEDDGDCTDFICMLDDQEDAENKKVNMILYHYAQAVREAVANPSLRCAIVNEMLADEVGYGVSLHGLAAGNATLTGALNTALRQSMASNNIYPRGVEAGIDALIANPNWDANSYLRSKLTYGDEAYEPVVYFIKYPTSCQTNRPVSVIIGEAVNCCDEVAGWKDGVADIFSEEEIMASDDINIFVGTGMPSQQLQALIDGKPTVAIKADEEVTFRMNIDIDTDRHQIKAGHRYDSSCKSEVYGWRLLFSPAAATPFTYDFWQDFDPMKIKKNDINASKIFTDDKNAFTMNLTDFNAGRSAFIGAWEYDWYASAKLIVNTCSPWVAHSVGVKMKFSHEWYFFDCGVMNTWFPNVGSHKIIENEKCMFDLVRKM